MASYKIRQAKESEVDSFINWGNTSGWNMGAECTKNYYKDFPNGWFVGEISPSGDDRSSTIIAKLYCTKYTPSTLSLTTKTITIGFIGFFMVSDAFQNQGFGYQLLKTVLETYFFPSNPSKSVVVGVPEPDCSAVGLYAAPGAVSYYERFGFKTMDKATRFKGPVSKKILDDLHYNSNSHRPNLSNISGLENSVSKFDHSFSQAYRPGFWRNWGTIFSKEYCLVYKAEDGTVQGLGALRPLPEGFRLGPLYANSFQVAEVIFTALCRKLPEGTVVILDVLESNLEAMGFFRGVELPEVLRTCYMWKGEDVDEVVRNSEGIYAVASLDFN